MKICPRCLRHTLDDVLVRNALSRADNQTYICNDCGQNEAMIDYYKQQVEMNKK